MRERLSFSWPRWITPRVAVADSFAQLVALQRSSASKLVYSWALAETNKDSDCGKEIERMNFKQLVKATFTC